MAKKKLIWIILFIFTFNVAFAQIRLETIRSLGTEELKERIKTFKKSSEDMGALGYPSNDSVIIEDIKKVLRERGVPDEPSDMKDREIVSEIVALQKDPTLNAKRISELRGEQERREVSDAFEKIKDEGKIVGEKKYKYICDLGDNVTRTGGFSIATTETNIKQNKKVFHRILSGEGTSLKTGDKYLQNNIQTEAIKPPEKDEVSAANIIKYLLKNGRFEKKCVGSIKIDLKATGIKGVRW